MSLSKQYYFIFPQISLIIADLDQSNLAGVFLRLATEL
jgi:hypothetical protein